MMDSWYELEGLASGICYSNDYDALIWQYTEKGVYATTTFYNIINFGGLTPIFIPSVWQLHVPPRVHIFLWLLAHNKLMTRDNLEKRNLDKPEDCVFCCELESINHLFFYCIVARQIWPIISECFRINVGHSYESTARFWVSNKNMPC
jgi:hypothetical protein